jgi:hypothetical protein
MAVTKRIIFFVHAKPYPFMPALCRKAKIPYLGTSPIHDCINAAKEPWSVNTTAPFTQGKQVQDSVLAVTHWLEGPEVQNQRALADGVLGHWGTIKKIG